MSTASSTLVGCFEQNNKITVVFVLFSDLSPANILLGDRGHILLTYFSQWNTVDCILNDDAINNLYCAPGQVKSSSIISM